MLFRSRRKRILIEMAEQVPRADQAEDPSIMGECLGCRGHAGLWPASARASIVMMVLMIVIVMVGMVVAVVAVPVICSEQQ